MADKGAAIVFCPCSNLFLGSGLFRIGRATDPRSRVKMAWGSDIGAGNRFSMLNVLDDAYKTGMCNNAALEDPAEAERNKISPYRGFWSITLGGAEGLYIDDLVGNFAPGKEADFVVLDWNGGPAALAWRQSWSSTARAADDGAGRRFAVRHHDGGRRPRGRRDLGDGEAALQEGGVSDARDISRRRGGDRAARPAHGGGRRRAEPWGEAAKGILHMKGIDWAPSGWRTTARS
jgi:hypothetical protein